MSVTGIASSILSSLSSLNGSQNSQSPFQQIGSEFQQLGQDIQSGNLTQAQSVFSTLEQQLPGLNQGATAAATTTTANAAASSANPVAQAFTQLGQDLQSGNLQAASQDYTTLQQDAEQNGAQLIESRHFRHHSGQNSTNSSSSSSSSSSQETTLINQAFSQLAQDLQGGNLSGAQSAFATLQNDLQQIGGLVTSGLSSSAASTAASGLNVTA